MFDMWTPSGVHQGVHHDFVKAIFYRVVRQYLAINNHIANILLG
jgi:hypothetical protein